MVMKPAYEVRWAERNAVRWVGKERSGCVEKEAEKEAGRKLSEMK